ncbi:hypothetical protein PUNSTDRAFT_134229 [Punctularia strigosozonata HHB-11173 SS5]|uniref:uncharacterized protein n=1 Tax=Punctularia strigosozonata (strain HHB-11173) TaxID=741275 RepID=UPI0004416ABF|nr:uncharacterized protein PUNSTDRAFT_134229 [Punctularia strigosozonata HHB-11173 SS5]EIN09054.1 hypothetical protein PUNSTDRAFT_134229 [Punctularia strigosozonata HHB-11173 SS5]
MSSGAEVRCYESTVSEGQHLSAEWHNRSAPVNQLPPEVLSLILRYVMPDLPRDGLLPDEDLAFTGVCRYWRQVALDTPEIWSGIPNDVSLEMIQMFLARSKNAPATIFVGPNTDYAPAVISMVLPHIGHTRYLSLDSILSAADVRQLARPAPLLAELILGCQKARLPRLPDDFLGLCAPRLQRLYLFHVSFSWDMMRCTSLVGNLRRFELSGVPADSLPTGEQLYRALQAMPGLERLFIRSGALHMPPTLDIGRTSDSAITLPRLTALNLYGPGQFVCNLLCRLKVPPTASVILGLCNFDQWDIASWPHSPWMNFLGEHRVFHPGSFTRMDYHSSTWEWSLTCSSRLEGAYDPQPSLRLTAPHECLVHLLRELPMENVKILQVEAYLVHDPAFLEQVMGACKAASEIRLANYVDCRAVFPLLASSHGEDTEDHGLLPALRRIHIRNFTRNICDDLSGDLSDFLSRRAAATNRELEISLPPNCGARSVEILRSMIGELARVVVCAV